MEVGGWEAFVNFVGHSKDSGFYSDKAAGSYT